MSIIIQHKSAQIYIVNINRARFKKYKTKEIYVTHLCVKKYSNK